MSDDGCEHCEALDEEPLPEGGLIQEAREYRTLTGHWPSCDDAPCNEPEGQTP